MFAPGQSEIDNVRQTGLERARASENHSAEDLRLEGNAKARSSFNRHPCRRHTLPVYYVGCGLPRSGLTRHGCRPSQFFDYAGTLFAGRCSTHTQLAPRFGRGGCWSAERVFARRPTGRAFWYSVCSPSSKSKCPRRYNPGRQVDCHIDTPSSLTVASTGDTRIRKVFPANASDHLKALADGGTYLFLVSGDSGEDGSGPPMQQEAYLLDTKTGERRILANLNKVIQASDYWLDKVQWFPSEDCFLVQIRGPRDEVFFCDPWRNELTETGLSTFFDAGGQGVIVGALDSRSWPRISIRQGRLAVWSGGRIEKVALDGTWRCQAAVVAQAGSNIAIQLEGGSSGQLIGYQVLSRSSEGWRAAGQIQSSSNNYGRLVAFDSDRLIADRQITKVIG